MKRRAGNPRQSGRRVAVLGSVNVDFVVVVPALPEAGETVVGGRLLTTSGGKGANQAVAAARLGADAQLVGRIGTDVFGDEALRALAADGVDVSGIMRDSTAPTGAALIMVGKGGQNVIAVAPGANACVTDEDVDRFVAGLRKGDIVVLQLEVALSAVVSTVERAKAAGAIVILNAAPSEPLASIVPPKVDYLVVNQSELAALAGLPITTVESAATAAKRLVAVADAIVVTLGHEGALFQIDGRLERIEAHPVDAIDATGAGDAFVGALAFGLAAGWGPLEAVRLASAAGAAAVTRLGAHESLPDPDRLRELFGIELDGLS